MQQQCCYGASCNSSRGFLTRAEKVEMLKEYKAELENEMQGVKERITELENEK